MSITKYHNEKWETPDIRTATTGEAIAFERACVVLSSGEIVKTTADTDVACGLAFDSYADNVQGEYIQRGRLRFVAGGNITENAPLCPDHGTAGRVRVAVSGDWVIGRATQTASAGEFCFGEFDFVSGYLMA